MRRVRLSQRIYLVDQTGVFAEADRKDGQDTQSADITSELEELCERAASLERARERAAEERATTSLQLPLPTEEDPRELVYPHSESVLPLTPLSQFIYRMHSCILFVFNFLLTTQVDVGKILRLPQLIIVSSSTTVYG